MVAALVAHRRRRCAAPGRSARAVVPEGSSGSEGRREREACAVLSGRPVGACARRWARRGTPSAAGSSACTGLARALMPGAIASSQGRAIAVPSPRKTVRRESRPCSLHHRVSFRFRRAGQGRRFRNGSLSTIPSTSDREPVLVASMSLTIRSTARSVVVLQPAAQGVGQHLLGQAAGELARAGLEDRLQLVRAPGTTRPRGASPRRRPPGRRPCRARRRRRRSSPVRSRAGRAGYGRPHSSPGRGAAPSAGAATPWSRRPGRPSAGSRPAAAAAAACRGSARAPTSPLHRRGPVRVRGHRQDARLGQEAASRRIRSVGPGGTRRP